MDSCSIICDGMRSTQPNMCAQNVSVRMSCVSLSKTRNRSTCLPPWKIVSVAATDTVIMIAAGTAIIIAICLGIVASASATVGARGRASARATANCCGCCCYFDIIVFKMISLYSSRDCHGVDSGSRSWHIVVT